MGIKDSHPEYWDNKGNVQRVKHDLIRNYLGGWFPILGSWNGRIVYLDTHAGRGEHKTGELGSPLVALDTLLHHKFLDRLKEECEFVFWFIEGDAGNYRHLKRLLAERKPDMPSNVCVDIEHNDYCTALERQLEHFQSSGSHMAPAFLFVDPYGFKIPGGVLRKFMEFGRVEIFINVMWRELNMAISRGPKQAGMAKTLDSIFDGDGWRDLAELDGQDRLEPCIELIQEMVDAEWSTYVHMLGKNKITRYFLLHLTNHEKGRDLMKNCIWRVCPDGGFYASAGGDRGQEYLITPTPDLSDLRQWVLGKLIQGPARWQSLIQAIRPKIWRQKHLQQVLSQLRRERVIGDRKHRGEKRFSANRNPELFLKKE